MRTAPETAVHLKLGSARTLYKGFYLQSFGPELRASFEFNVHKLNYIKRFEFAWSQREKVWFTRDTAKAERFLRSLMDGEAERWMAERKAAQEKRLESSRTIDSNRDIPTNPGNVYLPFQRGGIGFVAEQFEAGLRGVVIGDEMGLGKTIQAIGIINLLGFRRVLIICPASLRGNWRKEAKKWLVNTLSVGIATTRSFPPTDIIIINYDIIHHYTEYLRTIDWDMIVADEAHRLKSPDARRTQVVLGRRDYKRPLAPLSAKVLLPLTGTPILNRPEEIYGIVHWVAPEEFPSRKAFERSYSEKYLPSNDAERFAKLNELQNRLRRTCMIRRLKADVLSELPPKVRQVLEIQGGAEALRAIAEERKVIETQRDILARLKVAVRAASTTQDEAKHRQAVRALREGKGAAMTELSRIRKNTAIAKIPYVIAHAEEALAETSGKILVFAHHQEVVETIADHFKEAAVTIYGKTDTAPEVREAITATFQTDPRVRLFIGSIGAAGVGLTLTAATTVIFAELDWVPGNIVQAEDRAHRIGQLGSVLIQHLVLEGSLDATIANRIVEKSDLIDAALDKEAAEVLTARNTPLLDDLLFGPEDSGRLL